MSLAHRIRRLESGLPNCVGALTDEELTLLADAYRRLCENGDALAIDSFFRTYTKATRTEIEQSLLRLHG
jgi:hypothetical protein